MVNDVVLGSYSTVSIGSPSWQPLTIEPTATTPDPSLAYASAPVIYDVLANSSDTYGGVDPASVTITTPPTKGTATVDLTTGVITYTPNTQTAHASFSPFGFLDNLFFQPTIAQSTTTDSYTYQFCSIASDQLCSTNTVTITGLPVAASVSTGGLAVTGSGLLATAALGSLLTVAGIGVYGYRRIRIVRERSVR